MNDGGSGSSPGSGLAASDSEEPGGIIAARIEGALATDSSGEDVGFQDDGVLV